MAKKYPIVSTLSVLIVVLIVVGITAKDYNDQQNAKAQAAVSPSFVQLGPCTSNCPSTVPVASGTTSSSNASSSTSSSSLASVPAVSSVAQPTPCSHGLFSSDATFTPQTPDERRGRGGFLEAFFQIFLLLIELLTKGGGTGTTISTPCAPAVAAAPSSLPSPAVPSIASSATSSSSSATTNTSGAPTPVPTDIAPSWAGYEADGAVATNTTVSSDWNVVSVDCSAGIGRISQWIGQGGSLQNDPNLPQLGTSSDCPNTATPTFYPWTERYPDPQVDPTNTVNKGDTMTASVTFQGNGQFNTTMTDRTQGWTITTPMSYSSFIPQSSEVLLESYHGTSGGGVSYVAIPKFPDTTYTNVSVTIGGKQQSIALAPSLLRNVIYSGASPGQTGSTLNVDTGPLTNSSFTVHWVSK